jgi:hypothetical protein
MRLQQHLDEGCADCKRRLRFWTAVSRVAMREHTYDGPAPAARRVRGHFGVHERRGFLERAAASLVFDSAREPLPVGVRAGLSSARQLVYSKAGRLVKLRVEQDDSESVSLAGQVVEESAPERALRNLPVLVQSGRRIVMQTLTNQSGEFAMDLAPAQCYRLVLGLPGSAMVVRLPVTAAVANDN